MSLASGEATDLFRGVEPAQRRLSVEEKPEMYPAGPGKVFNDCCGQGPGPAIYDICNLAPAQPHLHRPPEDVERLHEGHVNFGRDDFEEKFQVFPGQAKPGFAYIIEDAVQKCTFDDCSLRNDFDISASPRGADSDRPNPGVVATRVTQEITLTSVSRQNPVHAIPGRVFPGIYGRRPVEGFAASRIGAEVAARPAAWASQRAS